MKIRVSKRYILLMGFILVLAAIYSGGLAMASGFQPAIDKHANDSSRIYRKIGEQIVERSLIYRNINEQEQLNFSLKPTGKSEFELTFNNPYNHPVTIKIYNIIGNLITIEEAAAKVSFSKIYNFSEDNMRLFVVEVGNKKHNPTKKVTTI